MQNPYLKTVSALATVLSAPLVSQELPSPAVLLRDINLGEAPASIASEFERVGPWSYFVVDDGVTDRLYRTRGTPGSTEVFVDLDPNAPHYIRNPTRVGGRLFFFGARRGSNLAIYASDGTVAGTVRVPLPGGIRISNGFSAGVNDRLVFYAETVAGRDRTPWVSDGTAAGTRQLVASGAGGFGAPGLPAFDPVVPDATTGGADRLWFHAFSTSIPGGPRTQYWSTDGTPAGTVREVDLDGLAFPGLPSVLGPGRLVSPQTLFGTGPQVVLLEQGQGSSVLSSPPAQPIALRSYIFDGRVLVPENGAAAFQVTDGTVAGSGTIGLSGGSKDETTIVLANEGSALWFAYSDTSRGWRLAKLERSSNTAVDVAALPSKPLEPSGGRDAGPRQIGSRLVFAALGAEGRAMFSIDVGGAVPGPAVELWSGTDVGQLTRYLGSLLFTGQIGNSRAVYVTDGTPAGTEQLVAPTGIGASRSSLPSAYTPFGNRLAFLARGGNGLVEPWLSDGSSAGSFQLGEVDPLTPGLAVQAMLVVGSELWTFRHDRSRISDLLVEAYDGRPGVRRTVATVPSFNPFDGIVQPVVVGGRVVFGAEAGPQEGIWSLAADGNLELLLQTSSLFEASIGLGEEALLFVYDSFANNRRVLRTDGTASGTTDIGPLNGVFGDFSAARYRDAVWVSSRGLRTKIDDVGPVFVGTDRSRSQLIVAGDKLFGLSVGQLLVTEGPLATDVVLASGGLFEVEGRLRAVALGDRLLFVRNGRPWISDGTVAGTVELADVMLDRPEFWVTGTTRAVFPGTNPRTNQQALYVTDGTPAGTVWLEDLAVATPNSSLPEVGIAHAGRVFLSVTDDVVGVEPYVVDPRVSTEIHGAPCAGAGYGTATLRTVGDDPRLGATVQIVAASAGAPMGWLGFGPVARNPVRIPGSSCTTDLDLFGAAFTPGIDVAANGDVRVALSVPNQPALLGVDFAVLSIMATGRGALGIDVSPTVVLTFGR